MSSDQRMEIPLLPKSYTFAIVKNIQHDATSLHDRRRHTIDADTHTTTNNAIYIIPAPAAMVVYFGNPTFHAILCCHRMHQHIHTRCASYRNIPPFSPPHSKSLTFSKNGNLSSISIQIIISPLADSHSKLGAIIQIYVASVIHPHARIGYQFRVGGIQFKKRAVGRRISGQFFLVLRRRGC